ncbi:hypothetical protein H9I45_16220 [Polaribacter haliotis]|uniref:Uncharacterized protein n=1 Tax=Polaribacter haliotis TaxID=1888915 RepID=A0A7L8AGC3_9FLAO|nr:hypothetical protein [Polaribacter haliotis]QOD60859.1 hypothetical protein H9I45_16220 [Polaribacter haliotis]
MGIFRKVDLVLARFGNINAMKRTHVDTFTEEKITNVPGEKYGISEFGFLYVELQELAGYYFINTTVISASSLKTNKGAILEFKSDDKELICKSDDYMIESDFSNVSNRWISQISYPVSEEEIQLIQNKHFTSAVLKVKKHKIEFNTNI